jgi:hypothetical protein
MAMVIGMVKVRAQSFVPDETKTFLLPLRNETRGEKKGKMSAKCLAPE